MPLHVEALSKYITGLEAQIAAQAYRVERLALLVGDMFQEHLGGLGGEWLSAFVFGYLSVHGVAGHKSRPDRIERRGRVEGVRWLRNGHTRPP